MQNAQSIATKPLYREIVSESGLRQPRVFFPFRLATKWITFFCQREQLKVKQLKVYSIAKWAHYVQFAPQNMA